MSSPSGRVPRSLQTRLLLTVLGLLAVVWTVAVAATWFGTRHELNEQLDAHLVQVAMLLASQPMEDLESDDWLVESPLRHKYQLRVAYQVWHKGRLTARSASAPSEPLAAGAGEGLSGSDAGGTAWRVYSVRGREDDVLIQVGEQESARRHILLASLRSAVLPLLLAFPALALGIWWAVRASVRPLQRLGRAVERREPQSLVPLSVGAVPPEVQPLVTALNGLFGRMQALLESERRFTADAAHELRTPIAAIRMQAQVAQGSSDEASRQQALAATLQGCDRAMRVVEQLLQLARLEAGLEGGSSGEAGADRAAHGAGAGCDLAGVARALLAELAPQALARHQNLSLDAPATLPVSLAPALAQVLLRNLVDNALRYSPDGATVQVHLADAPVPQCVVEDSGPGLPPEALGRLGERFFRVLGTGQTGSGLGWSIVQRITRLHGLEVAVDRSPALGGLRVDVRWPGAASSTR